MNWLTNFVKPKLTALVGRKDVPENLWNNCPSCANMIHHKDLNENLDIEESTKANNEDNELSLENPTLFKDNNNIYIKFFFSTLDRLKNNDKNN